jgi:hypothetical protein
MRGHETPEQRLTRSSTLRSVIDTSDYRARRASNVISIPASAFDTGQPCFVASAYSDKLTSSIFGARASHTM